MITILVNILGLSLIGFIIYWFWFSTQKAVLAADDGIIDIKVKDGIFTPGIVEIGASKPITLRFKREDASPCAESVVFTQLNISRQLRLGQTTNILLNITEKGSYDFTCQMGMYQGKLIVR